VPRICFIGDSHLGSIRRAWDPARTDATFFALPGKGIARLNVNDGALSSDAPEIVRYLTLVSGGLDRIDGTYDVYVLHAMHLGIAVALTTLREMRGAGSPAVILGTQDFRAALRNSFENSIAVTTLHKLRQITDAPAIVSPVPLLPTQFVWLRERLVELKIAGSLARLFVEECTALCRNLGAKFVPQPLETLDSDGLATKAEYTKNAARFSARAAEGDTLHMNAQYGAAVIAAVSAAL
jgi:hypothetical protein